MNSPIATLFKAEDRGYANHGWLIARHSFSFASYFDPARIHFGALRVLNDDQIAGGRGFGMHAHDNMEIITIPLAGAVHHKDSMGNEGIINAGEVQVMSAGTGILHSEFNANPDQDLKLFQIWIFPEENNVVPRYDQLKLPEIGTNEILTIVGPKDQHDGIWIHQQAWFSIYNAEAGNQMNYPLKNASSNGLYMMVINGSFDVLGQKINDRDALGIEGADSVDLNCTTAGRLLIIEVPMNI